MLSTADALACGRTCYSLDELRENTLPVVEVNVLPVLGLPAILARTEPAILARRVGPGHIPKSLPLPERDSLRTGGGPVTAATSIVTPV